MAHNLIASDRVEGTPVCRPTGEQIGVIQRRLEKTGILIGGHTDCS
jgi:hypothetical protein